MTACPIRYQRQVPDRKGKIFYTSITSLSHISKVTGNQAVHGKLKGTKRKEKPIQTVSAAGYKNKL